MDFWTILLSTLLVLVSYFLYRTMTFFKSSGVPHLKPRPVIGNMGPVLFRKMHFVDHVRDYYKRWPDAKYVAFYDCITPVIILRDMELIKSVCVKNFDSFMNHRTFVDETVDPLFGKSLFGLKNDKWRRVRSILTPAFTASKMRLMFELMDACSKQFSDFIIADMERGVNEIDIKQAFTKFTNDVIASCAFGISVDTMRDPDNDFYRFGKKSASFDAWQSTKLLFCRFCPTLSRWLDVRVTDAKITEYFIDLVKTTIETRQKNGITRPDMLQLMMEQSANSGEKLDIIDITAQAFIFFFAGFDTSSSLMSFVAIAMALHPEIQQKLHEEIDRVIEQTNGKPTYEAINGMAYLEAVLHETLRYYPVIGIVDRECNGEFELPPALPGLKPFKVTPGMNVWLPAYGIHTDANHYDKPEVYNPERFAGQKVSTNLPTYIAFGIGPRACIGNRFVLLENKLVLFHLLSKCRFEMSSKLKLPIEFEKSSAFFTVVIEGGFWVKILPRK